MPAPLPVPSGCRRDVHNATDLDAAIPNIDIRRFTTPSDVRAAQI